jgi:LCP family protein required for cell wall assembly
VDEPTRAYPAVPADDADDEDGEADEPAAADASEGDEPDEPDQVDGADDELEAIADEVDDLAAEVDGDETDDPDDADQDGWAEDVDPEPDEYGGEVEGDDEALDYGAYEAGTDPDQYDYAEDDPDELASPERTSAFAHAYATAEEDYRYPDDDGPDPPEPSRRVAPPARPSRTGGTRPPGPPPRPARAPRAVILKQRRRRRRVLIGLTFFLSASVSMVGSGYVYLQYRLGQIPRVAVPSLVGDQQGQIMNVLLVGSDSRDRLEGKDALQAGKGSVSGQRSDTIMVLHIDPAQEQAAILSIPRDLFVPIAGQDYSDRVNAAFSLGGAQGLIETIQQSLGITINHYVEVDFVGFKDIVDAVGGVKLYLPAWVRDFTSGLDLHQIGCVDVDGTQGLAWVRSRNFQYLLDDGVTWVDDPRADLGRIERQQDFIRRMLKKALSSGLTNPLQLNKLLGIGVRDVTLDDTLSTKDITTLARRFNNLDANSVALLTLPTTPDDVDGASVLRLREEEAQPYLDRINGVAGATVPAPGTSPTAAPTTTVPEESLLYPDDVELRVLNGEGTPGAAAQAAAALEGAGFTVAGTGDATEIPRTAIRHPAGVLGPAQLLQRALAGGADLVVDDTVTSTDLVLVIGADYKGLTVGPVTPVPRPSTTVTTGPTGGSTTTSVEPTSTTAPPTTLGPTTLPPGVEC